MRRWARQPWTVLAPLLVAQWTVVAVFALTVRHNGWLYYQGGDEIWYWSTASAVGHGHLPVPLISFAWPLLYAPVALVTGGNFLAALPALVLFNLVVLLPVALASVYGIGVRIGGRAVGYAAGAAWVLLPFAAIPLFAQSYHDRYVEQFLPQALGLTALADFPSMVCLLVAAYLLIRVVETGDLALAALAGLAVGVAAGLKPSNLVFVPAPLVALAIAGRRRELVAAAVAFLPALLTLALWKQKGYGHVPAFSSQPEIRLAAGSVLLRPVHRYVNLDLGHLGANLVSLRQFMWSERLLEWLPLAGLVAVARRSRPAAALLGVWLAAFVVIKGSYRYSTVESGTFFRFLMPAFPAFLLLGASLPLIFPKLGGRLASRAAALPLSRARPTLRTVAVVAALSAIVPLAVVAAVRPASASTPGGLVQDGVLRLVTTRLDPRASASELSWKPFSTAGVRVFYMVFRARGSGTTCVDTGGAASCELRMQLVGETRATRFAIADGRGWTYRIAVAANHRDDPRLGGDIFMFSTPVVAR